MRQQQNIMQYMVVRIQQQNIMQYMVVRIQQQNIMQYLVVRIQQQHNGSLNVIINSHNFSIAADWKGITTSVINIQD